MLRPFLPLNILQGTDSGVIHLHGGPGVETKLMLPEAISVRFLQFGIPADKLVCLGEGTPYMTSIQHLSILIFRQQTPVAYMGSFAAWAPQTHDHGSLGSRSVCFSSTPPPGCADETQRFMILSPSHNHVSIRLAMQTQTLKRGIRYSLP